MIPAQFDYAAPATLDEALSLLADRPDDAKILAGGHSLIPAMKLRLAQPALLIDIGRVKDLAYIREEGGQIRVGALTTHYQLESSERLRDVCPLLPECAASIGDVQVRNKGTIGGSLAHAEGRERVHDGVDDGGRRADGAGLADALDAQRVHVRRRLGAVKLEPREHAGARHGVVHERPRYELALLVVDDLLVERLAD